jgi:hypothetical protein
MTTVHNVGWAQYYRGAPGDLAASQFLRLELCLFIGALGLARCRLIHATLQAAPDHACAAQVAKVSDLVPSDQIHDSSRSEEINLLHLRFVIQFTCAVKHHVCAPHELIKMHLV